jgi:hypothetical protein
LLDMPEGPIEVFLDLQTGWVVFDANDGTWIASHAVTAVVVRDDAGKPRRWENRASAMLELERLCPDCYAIELPAPCATCEGTGELKSREGAARA